MKTYSSRLIASLAIGSTIIGGLCTASAQTTNNNARPIVITPPAIKDGSNWSRAPFPAARQFDDVKAPDGVAIDKTGANSDSANVEPPVPPARVAIMQPATPAASTTAVAVADPAIVPNPGLLPTGRSTVAAATSVEVATFTPTIRTSMMSSREQVIADIEARMKTADQAVGTFRSTASQMSTDGRRTFKSADDDLKAKEAALKKSIRAARKANDAEWDQAREKLAADYEAYGAALAHVDMAVGASHP